jgi:hypothetical protein
MHFLPMVKIGWKIESREKKRDPFETNCKSPFPLSFRGARCGRASTPNCCRPLPHCWPPTDSNPTRVTRGAAKSRGIIRIASASRKCTGDAEIFSSAPGRAVAPFSEIASPTWEVRALFFTRRAFRFSVCTAAAAVMNSSYPQKFHSLK